MICTETKLRIDVAVAAYAYEFENVSLVDDSTFDAMCARIRPEIATGDAVHDEFFRTRFQPHTGQWVHDHPNIAGLRRVFMIKTKYDLCEDEGCDHYGTPHVCISSRTAPSDRAKFDMLHSTDLFGPIFVERAAPGPNDCPRCGGDVTKNPIIGGCHC